MGGALRPAAVRLAALLLALCAVGPARGARMTGRRARAGDPEGVPETTPSGTQTLTGAPTAELDRSYDGPVTTTIPRPLPAMPGDYNFGDNFPTGPPRPPVSNRPPPESPSGRWLHTSLMIDGEVFVYGGVGSYSTALYNDLWLYNYDERTWSEMQASFVPPFPLADKDKGMARPDNAAIDLFRPTDAPPAPAVEEEPPAEVTVQVGKSAPSNPIARQQEQAALRIVQMEPVPRNVLKAVGYDGEAAFLEVEATVGAEAAAHARANAHLMAEVSARHSHLLSLQSGEAAAASARGAGDPPVFWKSNNLSPNLMSPFIAADLWKYDLDTKLWSAVRSRSPDVPAPRWLHTAVEIKGVMVVFGGVSYSDIILGDLWVFNPRTTGWAKSSPTGPTILPREGHSATAVNDADMYVFGGVSYGHVPFNDMYKYTVSTNQWTMVQARGDLPPPRWLHTASKYTDVRGVTKIYVFGGVTRNWIPLDDLYVFDVASASWTHPKASGVPPYPRMMHTALMMHTTLFIHAGTANNIPLEDTWTYDIVNNEWQEEYPSGPYPFARFGHSSLLVMPPAPAQQRQTPPEWKPRPLPDNVDPLTPLINDVMLPRPYPRYRKEYNFNLYALTFGGAGPKPRDTDYMAPDGPTANQPTAQNA